MTETQANASVRHMYAFTVAFGVVGAVPYALLYGLKSGLAFLFGAAISLGNLWLFNYLTRSLAPSTTENKPWSARAFVSRYLLLFAGGYAITKALNVSPLPVVLGLLASTAAVLVVSISQIFRPSTR